MSVKFDRDRSGLLRDRLIKAFRVLDRNRDGGLSEAELDLAIIDPALEPDLSVIVAVLKAEFDEIKNLKKPGIVTWTTPKPGLTEPHIVALAQLLVENFDQLWESDDCWDSRGNLRSPVRNKGLLDRAVLAATTHLIMEDVRAVLTSDLALYKNGNPFQSINMEAIRQGRIGNCVFLSALASVANFHPQTVAAMIKDNGDDTYNVTFPGDIDEPVIVDRPTTVELALYTRLTEWGFWPAVIEKAFGALMKESAMEPKLILAENTSCPEYWIEIFRLLTAQDGKVEELEGSNFDKVADILTKGFREKRCLTAWSKSSSTGETSCGIPADHSYTIIDWNARRSRIILRNPYGPCPGSEPETDEGEPLDGHLDGIFGMDLDQFWANFCAVHYEVWSAL